MTGAQLAQQLADIRGFLLGIEMILILIACVVGAILGVMLDNLRR